MEKKQKLGKLQKAWVKALKSNKYPQTTLALNDENGYCCLGVLEKLEGKLTKGKNSTESHIKGTSNFTALSKSTMNKYGFYGTNGKFTDTLKRVTLNHAEAYSLSSLNDQHCTFTEIAEFIENNPELVFKKAV